MQWKYSYGVICAAGLFSRILNTKKALGCRNVARCRARSWTWGKQCPGFSGCSNFKLSKPNNELLKQTAAIKIGYPDVSNQRATYCFGASLHRLEFGAVPLS